MVKTILYTFIVDTTHSSAIHLRKARSNFDLRKELIIISLRFERVRLIRIDLSVKCTHGNK